MPIAQPTESHADTLGKVLSDGKHRLVMELVFALKDSGQRLDYSPHHLYHILDITLRKNRKRLKQRAIGNGGFVK